MMQRPTVMEVDLSALGHNWEAIRAHVGRTEVMPIVKANAYGHGLVSCARHLESLGARWLGVAFVEEGMELRRAGVRVPILVMGGILGDQIRLYLEHDLDMTASSVDKLKAIEAEAGRMGCRARVHLKIDTGMERIGVHYYHADRLFEAALRCRHCDRVGVYSHLVMTHRRDAGVMRLQMERFLEAVDFFERRSEPVPLRHLANSAGMLGFPECHFDLVRPGLAIYGVYPSPDYVEVMELRPAMALRSRVVYFKVVPAGAGVGYDWTWRAWRQTRLVTVPVGYGDGYFRRLSNCGEVLIRGRRYPIVGNVCMDQFMVDIGDAEAYNGEEVVLIGYQGEAVIRVEEIAGLIGSSAHEVLVSTNLRVPRVYHS